MQKQFEYQPFDRVTVEIDCEIKHADTQRKEFIKRLFPAVLSGISFIDGSFVSGAYIRTDRSFTTFTCDVERIKPGHYDEFGNWLPQLGEPCHFIDSDGTFINCHVTEIIDGIILAKPANTPVYRSFVPHGGCAIDYNFSPKSENLPEWAILRPGRIKTAE